jgi:hypothetical protein
MKTVQLFIAAISLIYASFATSQDSFNYEVKLNPVQVEGLPGLHSYVFGQHDGKWIIIGGRKDGIHARQPFNAFPENFNNSTIYVVDVYSNELWTSSLDDLAVGIQEQLQSTNLNFFQSADTLYMIGGYSYAASAQDHITHPKLTTVIVSNVIDAIISEESITTHFQQIEDAIFANTGGQMGKIGDQFILVGGQRFDGRYNPMGNPTFTQTYKTGIQRFNISNTPGNLSYSNYSFDEDPIHLRRRDYNLLPQLFPNGEEGYMISAGVFQINADLPFLYPVDITASDYTPRTEFNQYLSHYHSAKLAIYDEESNESHNIFFGGMSQYFYENGALVQDDQVPFVKTISRVTRNSDNELFEFQLPIEMPGLKGAGSEFIPNNALSYTSSEVLKINDSPGDSILAGHIFGGIQSDTQNPFSNNETNTTSADPVIYEVWLKRNEELNTIEIDGKNPYAIQIFPNPVKNKLQVEIKGMNMKDAHYYITSFDGKIVQQGELNTSTGDVLKAQIKLNKRISKQPLLLTAVVNNKYYLNARFIIE